MTTKLSLPAFLKLLTNGNISMPNAMAIASKMYVQSSFFHVINNSLSTSFIPVTNRTTHLQLSPS